MLGPRLRLGLVKGQGHGYGQGWDKGLELEVWLGLETGLGLGFNGAALAAALGEDVKGDEVAGQARVGH